MTCNRCGKELTISVYNEDKTLKSRPKCSEANGQYHVFHPYPEDFGITDKRSSGNSPEGAQSYCTSCRGGNHPRNGISCDNV